MKQKCRLSLNLAREGEQRSSNIGIHSGSGYPDDTETLHIRSQRDSNDRGRLEQMEVTLSRYDKLPQKVIFNKFENKIDRLQSLSFSELYLAPEMMYASLGLPVMVREATKDLPQHLIKDCFSHILITGRRGGLFIIVI